MFYNAVFMQKYDTIDTNVAIIFYIKRRELPYCIT